MHVNHRANQARRFDAPSVGPKAAVFRVRTIVPQHKVLVYPQMNRFTAHGIAPLLTVMNVAVQAKVPQVRLHAVGLHLKRALDARALLRCRQIGAEPNPAIDRQIHSPIDEGQLDAVGLVRPQQRRFFVGQIPNLPMKSSRLATCPT